MVTTFMGNFIANRVRWVEQHARLTILLVTVLTIVAGVYSSFYASIDSDLSKLIKPSADTAWYQDNEEYKRIFPDAQQTAVIVVSGESYREVEVTAQKLAFNLSQSGEFQFVRTPGLEPFIKDHRLYYLEINDLESWLQGVQFNYGTLLRLSEDQSLSNIVLILADQLSAYPGMALPPVLDALIRSIVQEEVVLESYPRLVPPVNMVGSSAAKIDKYAQLIVLKGEQELGESLPNAAIVRHLQHEIDQLQIPSEINIRLTGEVVLAHEEISAGLEGVGLAGGISLLLLVFILGFGVRSWQVVITTFTLLFVGVVLTSAYATLVVGSYNTLSLVFLVMFFGLGVDFAIHFSLKVRDESLFSGARGSSERAARDIGPALLLCTLTSAIGFLSFVPTAYNGLGELGVISAGGMVIAFLLSVTLLPAMFSLLGGLDGESGVRIGLPFTQTIEKMKPRVVIVSFLILIAISVSLIRHMSFDYSVLALRDESSEGMRTLVELQQRQIVTDYSVVVVANNEVKAQELTSALLQLNTVGDVFSISDLVPSQQQRKSELLSAVLTLVDSVELEEADQEGSSLTMAIEYFDESELGKKFPQSPSVKRFLAYVLAVEKRDGDDGYADDLKHVLNVQLAQELDDLKSLLGAKPFQADELPESIFRNLVTSEGRQLLRVQPARPLVDRVTTDHFIAEVQKVAPNIAGRSVVEWGVGNVVVESFIEAVVYSAVAIFILLIAYFRSLVYPLLVIFPLSVTVLFTFAFAQLIGLSLNMANILVVPLIFGLGVDTGVHVIHRFKVSRSLSEALASSTSRAVVISALTTIGTFASLSISPHKGAASIGVLLSIAITILLITTFVALPAVLAQLPRDGRGPKLG